MNLLRLLLRASRGAVALSILAGVCGGLSGVALIAIIQHGIAGQQAPTALMGWAFVALCAIAALTRVASQAAMVRLAQGSVTRLALHLCSRIMAVPLERFEEMEPASLVAILTEDIIVVTGALSGLPLLCINLPVVLGCLAYIGYLSPAVLALGLLLAVPAIVGYHVLASRGFRHLRMARAGQDALVAHFRSLIDGFCELKLHRGRREAFLGESLEAAAASVRQRNVAGLTMFALAAGWSQLAFFGILGGLLFVLPGFVSLSPEILGGIVLAILYLMSPLDVVLTWMPILSRAQVSLLKIQELIPTLEELSAGPVGGSAGRPVPFQEAIHLRNVSYTYQREPAGEGFALGPIDLTIRKGEIIFLVGGNGSGKTTLVKLLTGLYETHAGEIRVDGSAISGADREEYRQLFSAVFADGHLFPSLLGLEPRGLDARARELLTEFELDGVVRVENGRFSSTDLSQGQRKRLALLTACLEERPICIFDEWAAYQDPHFKKTFYDEFLPELKAQGNTLLVISHDEDYYGTADRIIRLADGLVCEDETSVAAERIS
jgi:putative ATP-binding cassette transporter